MSKLLSFSLIYILGITIIASNILLVYSQSSIHLKAEFKPHENLLLASNDVHQITKLSFNTTDENICPIYTCEYSLENGELRYNKLIDEYAVEGLLKINFNGEEESKLYDIRIDVMANKTLEIKITTVHLLSGNVSIGGNAVFNPYYEYNVVNGSLAFYNDNSKIDIQANKL